MFILKIFILQSQQQSSVTSTTNTGTGASNEVLSMAELAAGKGFFPKCFQG